MEPGAFLSRMDGRLGGMLMHSAKAARWLGDLLIRTLLTLLYFTLLVPFGLATRLLHNPLRPEAGKTHSFWVKREVPEPDSSQAQKGY